MRIWAPISSAVMTSVKPGRSGNESWDHRPNMWTQTSKPRAGPRSLGRLRIPHGEIAAFVHGHREYE